MYIDSIYDKYAQRKEIKCKMFYAEVRRHEVFCIQMMY